MKKSRKAFTLVELLVVISIIILLISILVPAINKIMGTGYKVKTQSVISELTAGIGAFHKDEHHYPMQRKIDSSSVITSDAFKLLAKKQFASFDGLKCKEVETKQAGYDFENNVPIPAQTVKIPIDQYDDKLPILYYPSRPGITNATKPEQVFRYECNKSIPDCKEFKEHDSAKNKKAFFDMLVKHTRGGQKSVFKSNSYVLVAAGDNRCFFTRHSDGNGGYESAWDDNITNFERE